MRQVRAVLCVLALVLAAGVAGAITPARATTALPAATAGAVYLLHAASTSNIHALPGAILWLKRHGYRFGTLDGLL